MRDVQTAVMVGVLQSFSWVLWGATEPHPTNFTQSCFRIKHFALQWSKWFLSFSAKEPSFLYRVEKWGLFTLHSAAQPLVWWPVDEISSLTEQCDLTILSNSIGKLLKTAFFSVKFYWLVLLLLLLPEEMQAWILLQHRGLVEHAWKNPYSSCFSWRLLRFSWGHWNSTEQNE